MDTQLHGVIGQFAASHEAADRHSRLARFGAEGVQFAQQIDFGAADGEAVDDVQNARWSVCVVSHFSTQSIHGKRKQAPSSPHPEPMRTRPGEHSRIVDIQATVEWGVTYGLAEVTGALHAHGRRVRTGKRP
ncbi:MAG: hypothetical protein R2851_06770 [Caldilineaceae bacterium]